MAIAKETLIDMFNLEDRNTEDSWQLSNGHDMLEILNLGYLHVFGAPKCQIDVNILSTMLRLSFTFDIFQKTSLFKDIRTWEKRNKPLKIFE